MHDLGGTERFATPVIEPDEPVFHHEWERRALGVTLLGAMVCSRSTSQFRHAVERMAPDHYLTSRYYEHWTTGIATLLVESGKVDVGELEARAGGAVPLSCPESPDGVHGPPVQSQAFTVGDHVRVRLVDTRGHTRCPRYVRGRRGKVARVDVVARIPDVEAHADASPSEPTYCVAFDSRELWGGDAEEATVHVDLWQSYLEPT